MFNPGKSKAIQVKPSFSQSTIFLYFTKIAAIIQSSSGTIFILEEQLQPFIVYIKMYLTDISILNVLLFERSVYSYTF